MNHKIKKISEELQKILSSKELFDLAYDLEIKAKDEYYKRHPEEIRHV